MGEREKLRLLSTVPFRITSVLAALFLSAGITAASAQASPLVCQRLETRLAQAESGMDAQSLWETLKMQRIELGKVRGQAAAMNCLPGRSSKSSNSSFSCGSLLDAISAMQENLTYYENLSKQQNRGSDDREKILAALKKNNCDAAETAGGAVTTAENQGNVIIYGTDPIQTGSVIEFGDPEGPEIAQEPGRAESDSETGRSISHIRVNLPQSVAISDMRGTEGSYITMCVRTCDGYYFPASYTSGLPNFSNDNDLCRSRCPNADVELYYYSVPGQDTRNMTSLSGKKYMDQPFALKYRSEKPGSNPSCSCRTAAEGFSVIGGSGSENDFSLQTGSIGAHAGKVNSAARPVENDDFAAKVRAALNAKSDAIESEQKSADSSAENLEKGNVRVVGPKFFPDPKEGAILRSPGPSSAQ